MLSNYEIDKLAEALKKKIGERDRLLTINQVAEKLGTSVTAIYTKCNRNKIPYHKVEGNLYFSENEVDAYYLEKK